MIAIGSDEKTDVTDFVVSYLQDRGVELFGPLKGDSSEWAEVGISLGEAVGSGECSSGVLFCWSGTGASIAANKVKGVRAALCVDAESAKAARKYNHANVLVMSLRLTTKDLAKEIMDAWFDESYGNEEFDVRNVEKIKKYDS